MIDALNTVVRLEAVVLHEAFVGFLIVAEVWGVHDEVLDGSVWAEQVGVVKVPSPVLDRVVVSTVLVIVLPPIRQVLTLLDLEPTQV